MMRRALVVLALVLGAATGEAHVGSPDVFYEGAAGPYPVFVTVRMPQVIPGIATIEARTQATDVTGLTVVPMQLTGPGSELPPTPDRAERSAADPQFFTASLWLMERGSLQVRLTVEGARGRGVLAVPIPALAQRTLTMDRGLGTLLFALMLLLALSLVAIAVGAVREATLEPGIVPAPSARKRTLIAAAVASVVVTGVIAFGNRWWNSEADMYARFVAQQWRITPTRDGCTLRLPVIDANLLPDHGHDIHLFVVRTPQLDQLAHLHPVRQPDGSFAQALPSLPAGTYAVFADVVTQNGFPVTGTAQLALPALDCPALSGDDSAWGGASSSIVFDRPAELRAGAAFPLRFRVVNPDGTPATDLEPYMAMAGHAAVVRTDLSVFAHLHPSGSVAMPALMLARSPHQMYADGNRIPPEISFPFGFPQPGSYRIFVQIKRAGRIETGAFDVTVDGKRR